MFGVTGSKVRRKTPLNYAILNKKGFATVRGVRTRSRIAKCRNISAPSSPIDCEVSELNLDSSKRLLNEAKKQLDLEKGEMSKTCKSKGKKVKDKKITAKKKIVKGGLNCIEVTPYEQAKGVSDVSLSDSDGSVNAFTTTNKKPLIDTFSVEPQKPNNMELEGLSRAEKIKALKKSIAELEAKEEAMQEDQELKELLERREQLARRVSATETSHKKRKSSKTGLSRNVNKSKMRKVAHDLNNGDLGSLDVDEFTKSKLPDISDIQDLLHISEKQSKKVNKDKKSKKRKSRRRYKDDSSSDSSESSESESSSSEEEGESEWEEEGRNQKRTKKGKLKLKSGLFDKAGNSRLVSNEVFAHAALDDEIGGDRDLPDLSFNLFVAGELEIILNENTDKIEKDTRLRVLRNLAYKHEYLEREEVLEQYKNFVKKIEKGKFKWGSKKDLQTFEQQLIYNISVNARKKDRWASNNRGQPKPGKWESRKKYCLEYNRGTCKLGDAHEGKINGQLVTKLHICKKCLVTEGIEARQPEKDCGKEAK